jgi:linker histone H1 and H5 family protein
MDNSGSSLNTTKVDFDSKQSDLLKKATVLPNDVAFSKKVNDEDKVNSKASLVSTVRAIKSTIKDTHNESTPSRSPSKDRSKEKNASHAPANQGSKRQENSSSQDRSRDKKKDDKKVTRESEVKKNASKNDSKKQSSENPNEKASNSVLEAEKLDQSGHKALPVDSAKTKARKLKASLKFIQLCKASEWDKVEYLLRDHEKPTHKEDTEKEDEESIFIDDVYLNVADELTKWSPVMFAIKDNRLDILEKLLIAGFNPNIQAKVMLTFAFICFTIKIKQLILIPADHLHSWLKNSCLLIQSL